MNGAHLGASGEALPSPLVPADVDLRDFSYMALDVQRLRDSSLAAKATGEEFRAAMLLHCAAWHQQPAASLPDDDDDLAHLCGFGRSIGEWMKVREGALRGWVRCNDGRLYHPVVAEKAMEAWQSRLKQRWTTECARLRKHNDRQGNRDETKFAIPTFQDWLSSGCPTACPSPVTATDSGVSHGQTCDTPIQGKGREAKGREMSSSVPDGTGGDPPASSSRDAKEVVFALGVPMLTAAGRSEKVARSFLAKQAKDHGDERVADALHACASERPVEPTSWLVQRLGKPMPAGMPDCPVNDIVALYLERLPDMPPPMVTDALRSRLRDRWRWLFTEPRGAGEPPRASNAEEALSWLRGLFDRAERCSEIVNDDAARRAGIVQGLDYIVGDAGIKRIGATVRPGRRVVAEAAS